MTSTSGPGILCKVCGDRASGKHYGVPSCDGCRGFFKRSIRRNLEYVCKEGGRCIVDVSRRNQCQACRFAKCLQVNMRREAVQHERAPRSCMGGPPSSLGSPFGLDLCRPSAFAPNFFMPLPLHFQSHPTPPPPPPPPTDIQSQSQSISRYFSSLSSPYIETGPYLSRSKVSLLCETLFGRSLFSPIGAPPPPPSRSTKDAFPIVQQLHVANAKEDEVTSSEESQSNDLISRNRFHKDAIFESAAKLLFLAVKWAKSVPSFAQLPQEDRTILLQESWADLFVLTSAQWNFMDANFPIGKEEYISKLQNAFNLYTASRIDNTEAACLKALMLFRPERSGLLARHQVACLQDQTLCLLSEKCGAVRMGHLLLLLPTIKLVADPHSLQEIFFKRTIGEVAVERILEDLLKS